MTAPDRWCCALSTHLSLNAPNALTPGERTRLLPHLVSRPHDSAADDRKKVFITVPPGPGLGMELAPDLADRFTATVRVSKAS